jgi:hypothetical protein
MDALVSAPVMVWVWIALLQGLGHKLSCLGAELEASLSLSPFFFDPPRYRSKYRRRQLLSRPSTDEPQLWTEAGVGTRTRGPGVTLCQEARRGTVQVVYWPGCLGVRRRAEGLGA